MCPRPPAASPREGCTVCAVPGESSSGPKAPASATHAAAPAAPGPYRSPADQARFGAVLLDIEDRSSVLRRSCSGPTAPASAPCAAARAAHVRCRSPEIEQMGRAVEQLAAGRRYTDPPVCMPGYGQKQLGAVSKSTGWASCESLGQRSAAETRLALPQLGWRSCQAVPQRTGDETVYSPG